MRRDTPRGRGPRRVAVGLLALAAVSACSGGVQVDPYPTAEGTEVDCRALIADAPALVAGLPTRRVEDAGSGAAWGDPPVVLRCGVEEPAALEPTSRCEVVAGIDWFSETTADGYLFTTIGRRVDVSVEVPAVHDPPADVLVDLADTIARHSPVEKPCQ